MNAMVMPFTVRDPQELEALAPGTMIEFTLMVEQADSYIEKIHIHKYEGVEQDPLTARRLKLMTSITDTAAPPQGLKVGEKAPDFSLIDQNQQKVALSQFHGKVVAMTFTYTHCVLPNFCFRTANNFRLLQKRFESQLGSNLVLITITFDPAHDTPEVMAQYGKSWNADPKGWRLLSGPPPDVEAVCNHYGISFWADEGLMNHSLHTIVIDRQGNVVADLEGNDFNADQLGDLVQSVLAGNAKHSAH
jgi:protein SCO1/2